VILLSPPPYRQQANPKCTRTANFVTIWERACLNASNFPDDRPELTITRICDRYGFGDLVGF
jgi:hypothetical protein